MVQFINSLKDKINPGVDVVLYNHSEEFVYENEIWGNTSTLAQMLSLSAKHHALVFASLSTNLFDARKTSLLVASNGKLLGIFDEISPQNKNFIVLDTFIGRVGLIINNDVYVNNLSRIVDYMDCDIIIAFVKEENLNQFYSLALKNLTYVFTPNRLILN